MGCGQSSTAVKESSSGIQRRQSVILPPPDIPMNIGNNVKFQLPPHSKIIVIIGTAFRNKSKLVCMHPFQSLGGPGSGKGRLVANLRSMFGMKLISVESVILKYLPKKVAHSMTLNSVDVS